MTGWLDRPLVWGLLWSLLPGFLITARHRAELSVLESFYARPTLSWAIDVFGLMDTVDVAVFLVVAALMLMSGFRGGVIGDKTPPEVA